MKEVFVIRVLHRNKKGKLVFRYWWLGKFVTNPADAFHYDTYGAAVDKAVVVAEDLEYEQFQIETFFVRK